MNERRSRYARILRQILIAPPMLLIWVYRHGISPFTPPSCRFTPTCSQYFAEALRRHGLLKGSYLGIRRLPRCHPCGGSGYDPVPSPVYPETAQRMPCTRNAPLRHDAPPGRAMQTGRSENRSTKRSGESAPHRCADRKRARRPAGYRLVPQPAPSAIKPRRFQAPAGSDFVPECPLFRPAPAEIPDLTLDPQKLAIPIKSHYLLR